MAGLPKPRKDHAAAMTRFARDCLHKALELSTSLQAAFGPDTANLGFRVGLHSGPVTAGVLRGQKGKSMAVVDEQLSGNKILTSDVFSVICLGITGRFQLFGDSVNTASRMESTGVTNKIQVSQETADHLIASGHQQWLTPRVDKVVAKGKGVLQTYFVNISSKTISSSTSSQHDSAECLEVLEDQTMFDEEALQHLEEQLQRRLEL